MSDKLLDQIFNLKFTSKQLNKQSQKSAKEEKAERLKVKKAIEKGNLDGAKIYAQNAIRKKNESLNYLRLASRLDAVVSRLDTQAKMQSVNKSMAGIVKALDKSLASNNLEQVTFLLLHLALLLPSAFSSSLLRPALFTPFCLSQPRWPTPWTSLRSNSRTWTSRASLWRAQ